MQTFLPYSDFYKSLDCLDLKRLNKQHVESYQIINTIENGGYWKNHPAVRMWSKNINALKEYFNINKQMCLDKGIKSNKLDFYDIKDNVVYPDWLGWKLFHISMRSNLLLKDYNFYSKYGWKGYDIKGYFWPVIPKTKKSKDINELWVKFFKK